MAHITVRFDFNIKKSYCTQTFCISDPGVGLTACGTQFTAEDYIVAMVRKTKGVR